MNVLQKALEEKRRVVNELADLAGHCQRVAPEASARREELRAEREQLELRLDQIHDEEHECWQQIANADPEKRIFAEAALKETLRETDKALCEASSVLV